MKYLLVILIAVFLIAGCSYNQRLEELERRADYVEDEHTSAGKRHMWLSYRDQINKPQPPYPKDIEEYGIKSFGHNKIQIDFGLIPTPISISKEHGRLYMVFRVGQGDGEFLQVHKQNVIKHSEFDGKIWDIRQNLGFVLKLIISELE